MKKTILLIIGFLIFTNIVNASTSYTSTSGRTFCNDNPSTGDNDNSGKKWIPITNNTSASDSGNFDCEIHGYYSGNWSSEINKDTNYGCPDNRYASIMECYTSLNAFVTCNQDGSGWDKYKIYCKLRDDTAPVYGDLSSSPVDNSYFKALNSKSFEINSGVNGGSPIVKIEGKFENVDNNSIYNPNKESNNDNNNSTLNRLETTEYIKRVDNDRTSNNYRPYSYNITEVCDEAGNCTNNIRTFRYNVYANNIDALNSSISGISELTSDKIAEANINDIKVHLEDAYNNIIVPVYKSDGTTIVKKVGIQIDYTNDDFFLNQYNRTGNSAIKIKGITDGSYDFTSTSTSDTKTNISDDKSNSTGNYDTKIKVYAPTQNTYIGAFGNFKIDNFIANTYDYSNTIDSTYTFASAQEFKFNPIYKTDITGDLENYGFVEGVKQNSNIKITRDVSATSNPNTKIYLEFGSGARNISDKLDLNYDKSAIWTSIIEGYQSGGLTDTLFKNFINNTTSWNISTKLLQVGGAVLDGLQNQYLSTHIKYDIDSETVTYNGDIIGKSNYLDSTNESNATQVGLKVLGLTHSTKSKDIVTGQSDNDLQILGNITKSLVKRDLRKNVYSVIRNITGDGDGEIFKLSGSDWSNNTDGLKIYNNKVLYFELQGETVVLGDDNYEPVEGRKTIVVKGGDLYIKSNMYYPTNSDILGIVVLKDELGRGGNIYIDPDVTKIVGSIYADKSVLTAKDINFDGEIDFNEELDSNSNQNLLANQLYIKGQIFSENTIGGSKKTPVICPYFISNSSCDLNTAQKYDLNYLRRYFIYDSNNNGIIDDGDSAANGGANYKTIFDTTVYKYARYPVVIDYNPIVQITPPVLFD